MTANEIRAALARSGTTQSAIARSLDVSVTSVARVVAGHMRSKRIEAALEQVTGQPVNPAPRKQAGRKKTVWLGGAAA